MFRALTPAQSYLCDALRYLAALAVVIHHVFGSLELNWYFTMSRHESSSLGALGVETFFILSRFLISHTVARKRHDATYDFRVYFVERLVRIYIVYLPALFLAAVVMLPFPGNLGYAATLHNWLVNLFMLQGIRPFGVHAETFALLGPSWTLNYEFWFYLMFGLAALPMVSKKGTGFFGALAVFAIAFLVTRLEYFSILAMYWLSGAAAAALFQSRFRPGLVGSLLGAVTAILAFVLIGQLSSIPALETYGRAAAVAAVFLFALNAIDRAPYSALSMADVRKTFAHRGAAFSYSLYITHMIWLHILHDVGLIHGVVVYRVGGWGVAAVLLVAIVNLAAWLFAMATEHHNNAARVFLLHQVGRRLSPLARRWWK